eukprot:1138004-Pelagomonas_calceolata.AAC.1
MPYRQHKVWGEWDALNPQKVNKKAVTCPRWCGKSLNETARTPFCIPSYLFEDLDKYIMRNVSRFRLRFHGSKIWGTKFMKEGAEMDCPLQTVHLCLLERILGIKRTTPDWSILRECGHEPLQSSLFRAAIRFYNALLRGHPIYCLP